MRTLEYKIPTEYDGKKVLYFLKGNAGLSSRLIRSLKNYENGLMLNGLHTRTVDILHKGDTLTVNIPDDEVCPEDSNLDFSKDSFFRTDNGDFSLEKYGVQILYEDDDVIAVNKPAMLAIHPSHNHQGDTLANVLAAYLESKGKASVFRAVGRLDKGTSGIVICALNAFAANKLQGHIEKTYFAIASGKYDGAGSIEVPIYRPDPIKTYRTVDERGDYALTHWVALESGAFEDGAPATLLEVKIATGRTHQIRVHFAHLGTPLLGDTMYGLQRDDISHQALHCGKATFRQPYTGEVIELSTDLPSDMQNILDKLHKNYKM